MAAALQISSSLFTSVIDTTTISQPVKLCISSPFKTLSVARFGTSFASGSTLLLKTSYRTKPASRRALITVRCEQSTNESSGLDIWLGRFAMIGFAAAVGVEIYTGKGLLENFGLTSPLPTAALAVTTLVGVLTTVFIFQSASKS
ncbi:unnamed protein product [Cuscuta epithymum]|uniref:Stress enhanced protein 1, chloroplastic n=1 Tax=Cuscuta epithymum TaxID=186058 RepID=A0AAV0DNY3_9ASTE|nr:unnamed protein product [Cuscuta epithymum]